MIMTMRAKYVSQMRQMKNEKWEMARHAHVDCNIVFYSLQIQGRDYYSQLRFEWFSITIIHIFLWTNFLFWKVNFFFYCHRNSIESIRSPLIGWAKKFQTRIHDNCWRGKKCLFNRFNKRALICFSHSLKMDFCFRYIQFSEEKNITYRLFCNRKIFCKIDSR